MDVGNDEPGGTGQFSSGIFGMFSRSHKDGPDQDPFAVSRYMVVAAAVVVVLGGLIAGRIIVGPILMALFFAVLLAPSLEWLKSKGLSEILAIIVLTLGVTAVTVGIGWIVFNSLIQFRERIPDYAKKINYTIERFDDAIHSISLLADEEDNPVVKPQPQVRTSRPETDEKPIFNDPTITISDPDENVEGTEQEESPSVESETDSTTKEEYESDPDLDLATASIFVPKKGGRGGIELNPDTITAYGRAIATETTRLVSISFIIMLLAIFMLIEATIFPKKFASAFGKWNITNEHLNRIAEDIRHYMVLKGFISLIVGLGSTLLNLVLGIEYAPLWGLLAFFLNFIPNIGSIVASFPPIILALVDHDPITVVIVIVGYLFINCFMGYIIEPPLLGQGLGISPLVVLISLLFWGFVLGPIGMFLAAPLSVVLKIIFQTFNETRWISVMMDDKIQEPDGNIGET